MKYIDDYGNEFNNKKEVKAHAIKEFYKDNENLVNTLECLVTSVELLNWIIRENPIVLKEFKKDYSEEIEIAERDYAEDYFCECEEIED